MCSAHSPQIYCNARVRRCNLKQPCTAGIPGNARIVLGHLKSANQIKSSDNITHRGRQFSPFYSFILDDPDVTISLYCNFSYPYWEGCVICSIYLRQHLGHPVLSEEPIRSWLAHNFAHLYMYIYIK